MLHALYYQYCIINIIIGGVISRIRVRRGGRRIIRNNSSRRINILVITNIVSRIRIIVSRVIRVRNRINIRTRLNRTNIIGAISNSISRVVMCVLLLFA